MGPTRLNSDAGRDKVFAANSVKELYFLGASIDTTGAPLALSVQDEGCSHTGNFNAWQMTAINITNTATGHTWVYEGFTFTEQATQATLQPTSEKRTGNKPLIYNSGQ
jgi:hypothetical protein